MVIKYVAINRSLRSTLSTNNWIKDLDLRHTAFSVQTFIEYVNLWTATQQITLRQEQDDEITWKLSNTGQYSASSAYHAQFYGAVSTNYKELIWSIWAPPKCKFFSWLAIQNRIWTADRLSSRVWPHNPLCALCRHAPETDAYIFFQCLFTKRIWTDISNWLQAPELHPNTWGH